MDRAQCRGEDRSLFFPSVGLDTVKARAICSICLVREECLAFAVDDVEIVGIWGGTSAKQRQKLR
jgi:WhiB family redox-sensing transcriptional regulator